MKNRIYTALDEIKAEDQLKKNIYSFLQKRVYRKKNMICKRFIVVFASVAAIFAVGLFSYNLYFTETAFIDVDVNPSIELTLNRFGYIISTYAYNEDGEKVLSEINIKNEAYQNALRILIDKMAEMGYINDAGLFTATLQMKDEISGRERLDSLKAYIDSVLQSDGKRMEQDVFSVDGTTKNRSHRQNMTPAKYLAIIELQSVDPAATFDRCRGHSISKIKQRTHGHMRRGHGKNNRKRIGR